MAGIPTLLNGTPDEIFAILRSASSGAPHPRLNEVLDAFRRHWLAIARRQYPAMHEDFEDVTQTALVRFLAPERLAQLQDVAKLEVWARSIFVNTMLDAIRDGRLERRRRVYLGRAQDDPEEFLRDRMPFRGPSPEEQYQQRERLRIVSRCIEKLEVARLKFVDGLPDREIAARRSLSRDAVAGQLKRLRRAAKEALRDPE